MGFHGLAIPSGSAARRRIEAAGNAADAPLGVELRALREALNQSQARSTELIGERATLVKEVAELRNTVAILKAHFRDDPNEKLNRPVIFIKAIQRVVAEYYDVEARDMISDRRTKIICQPRQVAMYLAREMTPRSLPEIGVRFGGRDHTTVLHACRKVERLIAEGHDVGTEIVSLKALVIAQSAIDKAAVAEAAAA